MSDKPVEFPIQLFCDIDGSNCVVLNGTYSTISEADREIRFIIDRLGHNLVLDNGQFREVNGNYFDITTESNVDYVLDYDVLKSVYFPSKSITYISEASGGNDISFVVRDEGIKVDEETIVATSSRDYSYIGLLNQYKRSLVGLTTNKTNLENYKFLKKYLFLLKDIVPNKYGNNLKEAIVAYQYEFFNAPVRFFLSSEKDLKVKYTTEESKSIYSYILNRALQVEYTIYLASKKIPLPLPEQGKDRIIDLELYKPISSNLNFMTMGEEKYFFLMRGKENLNDIDPLEGNSDFFYYFKKSNIIENIANEIFIENGNFLNTFLSVQKVEYELLDTTLKGRLNTVKKFFLSFKKDGITYVLKLNNLNRSPESIEEENPLEGVVLQAQHLIKYSPIDNTFYMDSGNKIDFSFKDDPSNEVYFKADSNSAMALHKAAGFNLNALEDMYYKIPFDLKIEYTPERKPKKKRANGDTYYKVEEVK